MKTKQKINENESKNITINLIWECGKQNTVYMKTVKIKWRDRFFCGVPCIRYAIGLAQE